jgi:hypothetical protein
MAQVFGPLNSQSASGQFAKTMIFQRYNDRNYVKAYGKPDWVAHPPTELQLNVQQSTKSLMEAWPAISAPDKASWDALAIPARISRVNAYLKENYRLGLSGQMLTTFYPATEYPLHFTATGVTSPVTAGLYVFQQDLWAGQPYYLCTATNTYLYWDIAKNGWLIRTSLVTSPVAAFKNPDPDTPGTYTAYGPAYSGTATVVRT